MFALDEHLIFGTWMHPSLRACANTHLPAWWTRGGLRWRWVIILGYPVNYILGILNLLAPVSPVPRGIHHHQLLQEAATGGGDSFSSGVKSWYALGMMFSVAHMVYARMALRLIADIEKGVPRENVTKSMARWLKMNWVRALTTDLPAWFCFVMAALKGL